MLSETYYEKISKTTFIPHFNQLNDSRSPLRVLYPMSEVLFLVVSSVLSGYESNRGIEHFGELKLEWLRQYFPYKYGIPTHETIGNIIGLVDKKAFESCFRNWVEAQFGVTDWQLHIDGKRISGSVDKRLQDKKAEQGGRCAELIVNAYASESKVVIAQANVTDSGDEKEGAIRLINQLNLRDKTLTGDGNFCTKEILRLIKAKRGDYMMSLKKNQPKLYNLCNDCFDQNTDKHAKHKTEDNDHGRFEYRYYYSFPTKHLDHPKIKEYSGLEYFIKVLRMRVERRSAKITQDVHYYMSSSKRPIADLASLIRNHWSIENGLHWVLDVEFKEDDSRKRTGNQASNFSIIRKMALNLINKQRGKKAIKAWRMSCAVSDKIRAHTLGFS